MRPLSSIRFFARAFYDRGQTFEAKGDRAKAIEDYEKALRIPAKDQDDRDLQAEAKRRLAALKSAPAGKGAPSTKASGPAIPPAATAANSDPIQRLVHSSRGALARNKGDYDAAITEYSKAIRLNPLDADAYRGRGEAYLRKGDYERAIADLDEAIRLNPRHSLAYGSRGAAYLNKRDYDRAIIDLNEAIRLDPRDANAYGNRGVAYLDKGDYDRAIIDYNEAIRLDPRDAIAYSARGVTYEVKGNRAKAIEDYIKALSLPIDRYRHAEVSRRLAALQSAPTAMPPRPAATKEFARVAPLASVSLGRRVALVIGNAGYKVGPLQNPGNDASAVAEALEKRLNFDKVILRLNLGFDGFRAALREFAREASGAGLAMVYFAGHGTEVAGKNFLIPVDAALAKAGDLNLEAIALDTVLEQLAGVTTLKLVILDACRNNIFPLAGATRSASRGLSRIEPDENTLVIYAARDGTTADDGAGGRHSPFTAALLKHIATPGLEIQYLFREVRDDVLAATAKKQQPHVYGTLGRTKIFLRP
jgi:tetratricopeptide (TPR) repeat protein